MADFDEKDSREASFHDEWAESVDPETVNVKALENACTMPETRAIWQFLEKHGGVSGKKVLEIGCGCGEASVFFATKGADVLATDISTGMVELAKKVANCNGVSINGITCSAEKLPLEDESFDIVYAANVLHHVNLDIALDEAKRVLKKGGYFICWDPIQYNPAINIYRRIASGVRTVDEHPVDRNYIKKVAARFSTYRYSGFWLTTCLIFVRYFFIEKVNPNKERYWKKIIDDADRLEPMYTKWEKRDKKILKMFPFLKWMCWNMVIIAKKEK